MRTHSALIQRNIRRAQFSMPYLDSDLRDLISIIPSLLTEGRPSIGIYEHPACTQAEYNLLRKFLGRKPEIMVGRLPYRVMVNSLIVLILPSISDMYNAIVHVICIARENAPLMEMRAKLDHLADTFRKNRVRLIASVYQEKLPELVIYDIMRTGIVLAGKEPATNQDASSESCIFIGDLPGKLTDASRTASGEWNPFREYLDREVSAFIASGNYPSVLAIPNANPFIVPYLHILHCLEEEGATGRIEKLRLCLLYEFSSFPPTQEIMKDLKKTWKMSNLTTALSKLSFTDAFRLRNWLIPAEKDELPLFSWPPLRTFTADRLDLEKKDGLWQIEGFPEFSHSYAWVMLVWAAANGLIGQHTHISTPRSLVIKGNAKTLLLNALGALLKGTDILVPDDHRLGSVHLKDGKLTFSGRPFAILEQGRKHSLEIFEAVKKKTLIDDSNLADTEKKH